ncbi:hypothetical protein [Brucella anthropi]|uniref:hypothetical protein n=1 Tax=Brucella anthropi TaxID=529 RepID=UPI000F669293|nr:hypothetical protein [Brucella anthropi]RRY09039.1 hypothetical protein EGJ58_14285 [Brucella anthropi]
MTAVLNHVAIPFFDRVPPRGVKAVLVVFDGITDMAWSVESSFHYFTNALSLQGIVGPTFTEFTDWYWRVRNGFVDRPHPSDAYADSDECKLSVVEPYQPAEKTVEGHSLTCALAIVKAAHKLFEAQLDAGYSPLSLNLEDQIVGEALKEVLDAAAGATIMDADTHMTIGNKLADLLLGEGSDEIDAKFVACLTMSMQPEICAILSRQEVLTKN